MLLVSLSKVTQIKCVWGCFCNLNSVSLSHICVSVPVPCCLYHCSSVMKLEIWDCDASCFATLGLFWFHINFDCFSSSVQNTTGILIVVGLNMCTTVGNCCSDSILSIQEQRISFHSSDVLFSLLLRVSQFHYRHSSFPGSCQVCLYFCSQKGSYYVVEVSLELTAILPHQCQDYRCVSTTPSFVITFLKKVIVNRIVYLISQRYTVGAQEHYFLCTDFVPCNFVEFVYYLSFGGHFWVFYIKIMSPTNKNNLYSSYHFQITVTNHSYLTAFLVLNTTLNTSGESGYSSFVPG